MKLWQSHKPAGEMQSTGEMQSLIDAFTVGKDPMLDKKLLPYDVAGSKAHAAALCKAGILTKEELTHLVAALDQVLDQGLEISVEQEDGHTALEAALTAKLGPLGKKIHTGRSRNDQVATAIALYMKERTLIVQHSVQELQQVLLSFAKEHLATPMSGYTHMRQGMLSTVGLWAASYAELLLQDAALLKNKKALLDKNPLGTAAGYGPSLTLDRNLEAELLGFSQQVITAPAVQALRGKQEGAALFALQQVMQTLGKFATDLLLFSTAEFGYFLLPPELCTGSSIMPQKQNPDVLELIRAKATVVTSKLHEVLAIAQNLPGGYNRDFQLMKGPLFDAFEIVESSLDIMTLLVKGLRADKGRLFRALSPAIIAADEATKLACQGSPFRDAYHQVKETLGQLELTEQEVLSRISEKQTLGAPGNPGLERL